MLIELCQLPLLKLLTAFGDAIFKPSTVCSTMLPNVQDIWNPMFHSIQEHEFEHVQSSEEKAARGDNVEKS